MEFALQIQNLQEREESARERQISGHFRHFPSLNPLRAPVFVCSILGRGRLREGGLAGWPFFWLQGSKDLVFWPRAHVCDFLNLHWYFLRHCLPVRNLVTLRLVLVSMYLLALRGCILLDRRVRRIPIPDCMARDGRGQMED